MILLVSTSGHSLLDHARMVMFPHSIVLVTQIINLIHLLLLEITTIVSLGMKMVGILHYTRMILYGME